MKKQLFLLLFVLLVTGCSDDIPSSDYLGGDVKPKRLVSKIQQIINQVVEHGHLNTMIKTEL